MPKALIIYYSRTGNTRKMAHYILEGLQKEGLKADLKEVKEVRPDDLLKYDGILIGSPTYYGTMAAPIKQLLDDSVKLHGKLDGKLGAAFSSSANIAGGNETTILDILNAMLIHGMIVQGDPLGSHYGPVSIAEPDSRVASECMRMGLRFSKLANRLFRD